VPPIGPETYRRLLVSKSLLASHEGVLTPRSDAISVARTILTAHDAAELALAAIATEVAAEVRDQTTLMEYPAAIVKARPAPGAFPGRSYLDALNRARRDFKHAGNLPHVPDWYRVIEKVTSWIGQWCSTYLELDFDALQPDDLLVRDEVREFYRAARAAHEAGDYREALENLGRALLCVLEGFPRMALPVIGEPNPNRALLLTAFGVSASQLLTLEEFLPHVHRDWKTNQIMLEWRTRGRGHPANWKRRKVAFCLDAFLDVALKVQHAEPVPWAVPFEAVFDDVIVARDSPVELWHYGPGKGKSLLTAMMGEKGPVVATLQPGERLRCRLSPSPYEMGPARGNPAFSVEMAQVLELRSDTLPDGVAYVERELVEIAYDAKDDPIARHFLTDEANEVDEEPR